MIKIDFNWGPWLSALLLSLALLSLTLFGKIQPKRIAFACGFMGILSLGSIAILGLGRMQAGDAGKLVGALGAGKSDTALQVLREYGVAETTLNQMAARFGQEPKNQP